MYSFFLLTTSTTSSYSQKQIWMNALKKIIERERETKQQSQSCKLEERLGYSSAVPFYYSRDGADCELFSTSPPTLSFSPLSESVEKVCNGCKSKLSFISNRVCSICERSFCKNCCAEKFLHMRLN